MPHSEPVDGFRLAFDRSGPASRWSCCTAGRETAPITACSPPTSPGTRVVVPDLRGFGESDKHPADPGRAVQRRGPGPQRGGADPRAGPEPPGAGRLRHRQPDRADRRAGEPELVRALVIAPPLPGIGHRVLEPQPQREFWYQSFHQLPLAAELIDGAPAAVRAYLSHFWSHWSGPSFTLSESDLDHLVAVYGMPGAFTASIGWYRSGRGRGGPVAGRKGAGPGRPDRGSGHRAVARVRSAVPARLGGPGGGVLQRHRRPLRRRGQAISPRWSIPASSPPQSALRWPNLRTASIGCDSVRGWRTTCGVLSGLPRK